MEQEQNENQYAENPKILEDGCYLKLMEFEHRVRRFGFHSEQSSRKKVLNDCIKVEVLMRVKH